MIEKVMQIINVDDIKMSSVNRWLKFNRKTGQAYKTLEYKTFMQELFYRMNSVDIKDLPFGLIVEVKCYQDIDNIIKPLLDVIQQKYDINDRNCINLTVKKEHIKRGSLSSIKAWIYQQGG
jgi:Holliday junction resolvase RusA-like endonuclease